MDTDLLKWSVKAAWSFAYLEPIFSTGIGSHLPSLARSRALLFTEIVILYRSVGQVICTFVVRPSSLGLPTHSLGDTPLSNVIAPLPTPL